MRTKVTLALLFLNCALFAVIYWLSEIQIVDDSPDTLLSSSTSNLQSLDLTLASPAPGSPDTNLTLDRRADGSWHLAPPYDWPANPFALKRIIDELNFLRPQASFAVADLPKTNQTLADYGLDKPALTLVLRPAPPASPATLRIGNATLSGGNLYLLSPDGALIHVVKKSLAESLSIGLTQLRSDQLFSIEPFEARAFTLETATPSTIRLRRNNAPDSWLIETPINTRANAKATQLLITQLNQLRVASFLNPEQSTLARPLLNTPTLRLSLEGNNRRETLLIGPALNPQPPPPEPTPGISIETDPEPTLTHTAKLEDRPGLFTVALPQSLLATLTQAQNNLRDPRILSFDTYELTTLVLRGPTQLDPITLQRLEASASSPTAWQLVRNSANGLENTPADPEVVRSFIEKLSRLSAEKFVTDAPSGAEKETYGFNRPEREVTLSLASPSGVNASYTLQIGRHSRDRTYYAKLAHQDYIYLVPPTVIDLIPLSPLAFREHTLRTLPASTQITALKITRLGTTETILFDTPLPAKPELTTVQRTALDALGVHLRRLRAQSFFANTFTSSLELTPGEKTPWSFRLDATLTLENTTEPQTLTLFLTDRIGGSTQYLGSPEHQAIFVPEQPIIDALFSLLLSPADPGPPTPANIPAPSAPTP